MLAMYLIYVVLTAVYIEEISAHSYSVWENADCPGNNLGVEISGNEFHAMDACDAIANCAGFAHVRYSGGRRYQLKTQCGPEDMVTRVNSSAYETIEYFPKEPTTTENSQTDGEIDYTETTAPTSEVTEPEEGNKEEVDITIETAGHCEFSVSLFHSLYGHREISLGPKSLEECLHACALDAQCQSVNHNYVIGNCFISYTNKDAHPDDYHIHLYKHYYQKGSCEQVGITELPTTDESQPEEGNKEDACVTESGPFGGYGGDSFSDEGAFNQGNGRISKITIYHGHSIDGIQVTYGRNEGAVTGSHHGGFGGEVSEIRLNADEYITSVEGWYGDVIDMLTFITNRNSYGPYGRGTENSFTTTANGQLAYISGRAGDLLDQLSFHFYCE